MMNTLYSLTVWLVWATSFLVLGLPAVLLTMLKPDWGFRFVRASACGVLALVGMPVVIRGADQVDWSRAYVVMGNHQSMIDVFAILKGFPRRPICVEKIELQRLPVYGWLSRAWGNIGIQREDRVAAIAGVESARVKLDDGFNIGIMPEGTRTKDGQVGPFKKGGFHLAVGAGAWILPFTINGSFERFTPKSWRLNKGPVEIVFGAPVDTQGYTAETVDALVAHVRAIVLASYTGRQDMPVLAPEPIAA